MACTTKTEKATVDMNQGPAQIYEQLLDAGEIHPDAAQAEAVAALQGLFERLLQPAVPKPGFFDRVFGGNPGSGRSEDFISGEVWVAARPG